MKNKQLPFQEHVICQVDVVRFTGVWYEIARLPHSFEKGLEDVTATYQLVSDKKIKVINQGFKNGKKKRAVGNAKIMDGQCSGHLGVSFFPLVRSPYLIICLDEVDYQYAVVTSGKDYLWILSRTPRIAETLYKKLCDWSQGIGFDTNKLIRVEHNRA